MLNHLLEKAHTLILYLFPIPRREIQTIRYGSHQTIASLKQQKQEAFKPHKSLILALNVTIQIIYIFIGETLIVSKFTIPQNLSVFMLENDRRILLNKSP